MKKFFLILLIGTIIFSSVVKAEGFYQYGVIAEIYNNDTVHYKLNIIFVNHTSQTVIIPLGTPANIQIDSDVDCQEQKSMLETNIVCSMNASNRTAIIIQYDSNSVSKRDSYFLFTDSFKVTKDTKILSVVIKLPEGTGLKEPTEDSYSPAGAVIGSDGRRPIISWLKDDLKAGDTFDTSIAFEMIGKTNSSFPFEIIIIIILISFSSLGAFYQFYWKGKNIKLILPFLKKDEKKIFDTIIKNGSGVNQKMIVRESGYSKAKVSKVLNSLRERGLVKLERIGRSNKVYMEKNFEKKPQKSSRNS
jgi:DNA-binding transcriptional ArsR family regulator